HGLRGAPGPAAVRGSWRATWAYTLLLTLAMAFTPIVWPLAVALGIGVLVLRRGDITAYGLRFLAAVGTPLLVLAPWSLTLLTSPASFLKEAGLDLGAGTASAVDLLGISPGGPKAAGGFLLLGIVLAALAALLRGERQFAIRTAWAVALVALLFAGLANGSTWAGPATLVYGIALIAAALLGADGARVRVAELSFGWRQPVAALIALAALAAPALAAFVWMAGGATGPLVRRDPVQVPAFVAAESVTRDQPRTLVLGGTSSASVSYTLVRGSGARLGDAELTESGGSNTHLDKVVANLVAGSGADQGRQLSGFAIRYVLVRDGAPRQMSRVLDSTPGLSRLSQLDGSALWWVDRQVARVMIVPPSSEGGADGAGGEWLPVASRPVEAHTRIPSGAAGRVLRIADAADPGWQATLNGKALTGKTVDGWAQGFELPAEGGTLDLTYDAPITHTAWIWAQALFAVVLLVLALPGRRREIDDDLPEETESVPLEPVAGEGRRARRLRAAAQAEAEDGQEGDALAADPVAAPGEYIPAQQSADPYAAVPDGQDAFAQQGDTGTYAAVPQQQYAEWDAQQYQGADYQQYQGEQYQNEQYGSGTQPQAGQYGGDQYPAAEQYQAEQYQADPYQQNAAYDPYGYAQQQPYPTGTGEAAPYDNQGHYGPSHGTQNDEHDESTAPGEAPWHPGNASRGESE
ncbi:family 2 glycosyl transferase, partial [Streptomyces sp. 24-1644]